MFDFEFSSNFTVEAQRHKEDFIMGVVIGLLGNFMLNSRSTYSPPALFFQNPDNYNSRICGLEP